MDRVRCWNRESPYFSLDDLPRMPQTSMEAITVSSRMGGRGTPGDVISISSGATWE